MMADKMDYGLGRRKSAVAQVQLDTTKKDLMVNEMPLEEYFPTVAMQQRALAPLEVTSQRDVVGVRARVSGGGKQSQADAVRLGIARALLQKDEAWRKQLKEAGMLTRDPRVKERKKPGLKGARRAPQFSKR